MICARRRKISGNHLKVATRAARWWGGVQLKRPRIASASLFSVQGGGKLSGSCWTVQPKPLDGGVVCTVKATRSTCNDSKVYKRISCTTTTLWSTDSGPPEYASDLEQLIFVQGQAAMHTYRRADQQERGRSLEAHDGEEVPAALR